jgi:hypothetical protein
VPENKPDTFLHQHKNTTHLPCPKTHTTKGLHHKNKRRNQAPTQQKTDKPTTIQHSPIPVTQLGPKLAIHPNRYRKNLHREASSRYKTLNKKLYNLSQSQNPQKQLTYPRVVNNTNITFSDNEMSLLQKGPKYNLHAKGRNWIQNLALEAETAITQLPTNERESYRRIVADRIHTLQDNNATHTQKNHHETRLINSINKKLQENDAMIAGADKGNSIVVLRKEHYEDKIQDFLHSYSFNSTTSDPTNTFQSNVKNAIKLHTSIPHISPLRHNSACY